MRKHLSAAIIVGLVALSPARSNAQAVKWGPAPAVFPAGARMAVLQGDPSKAESITVRLDMPDGYVIAPHFHPTDEAVTVISGNFLISMGDTVVKAKTMKLTTSQFAVAPAGMHHYAITKGHTVVQVNLMGPFALTYVNASDDPMRKAAAKK